MKLSVKQESKRKPEHWIDLDDNGILEDYEKMFGKVESVQIR